MEEKDVLLGTFLLSAKHHNEFIQLFSIVMRTIVKEKTNIYIYIFIYILNWGQKDIDLGKNDLPWSTIIFPSLYVHAVNHDLNESILQICKTWYIPFSKPFTQQISLICYYYIKIWTIAYTIIFFTGYLRNQIMCITTLPIF